MRANCYGCVFNCITNIVVSYLNYGAFSSYAPVYDSTTVNLSKENFDLLLSTYNDETSLQYAQRYVIVFLLIKLC